MSRPTDWYVLELGRDPTPGDPWAVSSLARRLGQVADDAERAERDVHGLAGDGAVTSWIGAAGDVFRGADRALAQGRVAQADIDTVSTQLSSPGGGTQQLVDGHLLGLDLPPGTRVNVQWLLDHGYLVKRAVP